MFLSASSSAIQVGITVGVSDSLDADDPDVGVGSVVVVVVIVVDVVDLAEAADLRGILCDIHNI